MILTVPVLDVFFIDFTPEISKQKTIKSGLIKAASYMIGGPVALVATSAHLKKLGNDGPSLKRLIDEQRFNIIRTPTELNGYVNLSGNEWVTDSKKLKQRQYYIRHPKKCRQNALIEAKNFYTYIENEQIDELVNFIVTHCPVKAIRIEREELAEAKGKVKATAEGANLKGGANAGTSKKSCLNQSWPNGAPKIQAYEHYMWLDNSVMNSIAMLTESSSYTKEYECEFGCGLSASEAQTIGMKLDMHKKFSYSIYIQC